jgi:hypothetical protein
MIAIGPPSAKLEAIPTAFRTANPRNPRLESE